MSAMAVRISTSNGRIFAVSRNVDSPYVHNVYVYLNLLILYNDMI